MKSIGRVTIFALIITMIFSVGYRVISADASTGSTQQGTFSLQGEFEAIDKGFDEHGVFHTVVQTQIQDYTGTVVMENSDLTTLKIASIQGSCKNTVTDNGVILPQSFTSSPKPTSFIVIDQVKGVINVGIDASTLAHPGSCAWETMNMHLPSGGIPFAQSDSGITASGSTSIPCTGSSNTVSCRNEFTWDLSIGVEPEPPVCPVSTNSVTSSPTISMVTYNSISASPNCPPTAKGAQYDAIIGKNLKITLKSTDPDTPQNKLIHTIVQKPTLGELQGLGPRKTYVPKEPGTDQFTFKVNDGQSDSNIATVTIEVFPKEGTCDQINDKIVKKNGQIEDLNKANRGEQIKITPKELKIADLEFSIRDAKRTIADIQSKRIDVPGPYATIKEAVDAMKAQVKIWEGQIVTLRGEIKASEDIIKENNKKINDLDKELSTLNKAWRDLCISR